ncbi:MAG: GDP-mannose 4,6-dehydratase [archaeon]
MKKRALITGLTGQDGSYLAEFLLAKDYEVYGLVRRVANPNYVNIEHIVDQINILPGDLIDPFSLVRAVKESKPDEIYNLAAQSYVGISWGQPSLTFEINALGVLNLLEAMKEYAPSARFYQASTSEMFGNSSTNGLQNEETPFKPRSPYSIAKRSAYDLTKNYRESYGLFACNGLLFAHESERRGHEFVTRKISYNVAKISLGLSDGVKFGNLDVKRDWGHAEDYVRAMWLMLQQPNPDDFVIATGENHTIREFVDKAFRCAGIENWDAYVSIDPKLVRPAEVFYSIGDSSKARAQFGWSPAVTFDQLVDRMVKADIDRLSKK